VVGGMNGVGGTDRVGKMGGVSWYGARWNVTGGSRGMRCEVRYEGRRDGQ
jgi:hypothetical protein